MFPHARHPASRIPIGAHTVSPEQASLVAVAGHGPALRKRAALDVADASRYDTA